MSDSLLKPKDGSKIFKKFVKTNTTENAKRFRKPKKNIGGQSTTVSSSHNSTSFEENSGSASSRSMKSSDSRDSVYYGKLLEISDSEHSLSSSGSIGERLKAGMDERHFSSNRNNFTDENFEKESTDANRNFVESYDHLTESQIFQKIENPTQGPTNSEENLHHQTRGRIFIPAVYINDKLQKQIHIPLVIDARYPEDLQNAKDRLFLSASLFSSSNQSLHSHPSCETNNSGASRFRNESEPNEPYRTINMFPGEQEHISAKNSSDEKGPVIDKFLDTGIEISRYPSEHFERENLKFSDTLSSTSMIEQEGLEIENQNNLEDIANYFETHQPNRLSELRTDSKDTAEISVASALGKKSSLQSTQQSVVSKKSSKIFSKNKIKSISEEKSQTFRSRIPQQSKSKIETQPAWNAGTYGGKKQSPSLSIKGSRVRTEDESRAGSSIDVFKSLRFSKPTLLPNPNERKFDEDIASVFPCFRTVKLYSSDRRESNCSNQASGWYTNERNPSQNHYNSQIIFGCGDYHSQRPHFSRNETPYSINQTSHNGCRNGQNQAPNFHQFRTVNEATLGSGNCRLVPNDFNFRPSGAEQQNHPSYLLNEGNHNHGSGSYFLPPGTYHEPPYFDRTYHEPENH